MSQHNALVFPRSSRGKNNCRRVTGLCAKYAFLFLYAFKKLSALKNELAERDAFSAVFAVQTNGKEVLVRFTFERGIFICPAKKDSAAVRFFAKLCNLRIGQLPVNGNGNGTEAAHGKKRNQPVV